MGQRLQEAVMRDYAEYAFHFAAQKLHNFCSEFLGAFYLDVLKDRLYTTAANSAARRSAQSALYHLTHSLLRLFAPILSFTADEAWEHFTGNDADSVFLHPLYMLPDVPEAELLEQRWALVRAVRSEVQKELEQLRVAGEIGSSLAAEVELRVTGDRYEALSALGNDLRLVLITSSAEARHVPESEAQGVWVKASGHEKCPRCWHYRADVGAAPEHPDLCGRCVSNLYGEGEVRRHA
jgi:isoleucyl-tRNA synthetase